MVRRSRSPMFVLAAALLGLIALLATLQYRWLGQISAAERERMKANLASRTSSFALDFDREITRAHLTFQVEPLREGTNLAARIAERYDRWQATSRYPQLVKGVYMVSQEDGAKPPLQRYNPATRFLEPVDWPEAFEPIRSEILRAPAPAPSEDRALLIRQTPALWDRVPAIVIPAASIVVNRIGPAASQENGRDLTFTSVARHTIVALDRDYIVQEMLPSLAEQHFRDGGEAPEYDLAVVRADDQSTVYRTDETFTGGAGAAPDASAELFQVRMQEFGAMAAEVRRFASFVAQSRAREVEGRSDIFVLPRGTEGRPLRESPPFSFVLQHQGTGERRAIEAGRAAATSLRPAPAPPRWRLVAKHPSGSLENAVATVRRRNLIVSSGILAILGVSIGFLVLSTRRAQDLARRQMEFVAAVSHELRTPLAVIRSAADNLAEGVVREETQVRKYGELVRGEGRRLTEMVEQILELAGIHSGQRGFVLRPVPLLPLVHDVVRASSTLVDDAGLQVEYDIPETLPPVLGDEQALRRVVQNLLGNAIKYGAPGGWIGLTARAVGREVHLTVADRGIGIAPADQAHIFEPFYRAPGVIEAQIQGAGLGLSLVQRVVEAHGGRISVRSAPGEGSAFTVHLPAASEEPVPRTSAAADPAHRLS